MTKVPYHRLRAIVVALGLGWVATASARTIELTDADCDRMAVIGPQAPRFSWAMYEANTGEYSTTYLDLRADRALLIRYPLDRIPKGQRITRAEWIFTVNDMYHPSAGEQRLFMRRIIGDWGNGVCYLYRTIQPKPTPWTIPGAAGSSTDRAAQATGIAKITGPGEQTINVTEDVELWYTGAAENQGWILNLEGTAHYVRLSSPLQRARTSSRLRITYEPE